MSTFIGKILVVTITAVSLLFLGISAVAYATARNWPTVIAAEAKKADELKKKLQAVTQEIEIAKKGLEDSKAERAAEAKTWESRLRAFDEENKRDNDKIATTKDQMVTAEDAARALLSEVQAKREQIAKIQRQQGAVDKQAGEFRAHIAELTDRIHELERLIETAAKNHADLHPPTARDSALLR
jgi:chromosome segregation ATPase